MTRPQVERPMTREELMAMRAEAEKHWRAGRTALDAVVPGPLSLSPGEEKILDAYLDREYPLPAPEPLTATGPSGWTWLLSSRSLDMRRDGRAYGLTLPPEDRATVANLLCPFEDVVRATLEELYVTSIECHGDAHNLVTNESRNAFLGNLPLFLPLILKRLSQ